MGRYSLVIMVIMLAIGFSVSTTHAQRPVWEPQAIIDMEWSPDGQYLAVVTAGRELRVLNEISQTVFSYTVSENAAIAPLTLTFATVDWNSTSSQLAVGIGRRILVFTAPQFQLSAELTSPAIGDFVSAEFYQGPNYVHSMEFSPTNTEILASYADSRIVIWDLTDNSISFENTSGNLEQGFQWSPHQPSIYSIYDTIDLASGTSFLRSGGTSPEVVLLPDVPIIPPLYTGQSSGRLLTAYGDMVGSLWINDSITGRLLSVFYMFPTEPGYEDQRVPIRDMSWSSDDRYLAVITDNRVVWLVDLVENERRPIIFYDYDLTAIDWKPNSNTISIAYITPAGEAFIDNSLMPIFEDLYLEPITYTPTLTFTPTATPSNTFTPTNTPTSTFTPTNTPTFTPTFTPTPTLTPTRTPTPTATPIPLPPADTNLLTNPSFTSGLAPWNTVNFSAGGVVNGVLEVTQPTTVEYGVVWQSLSTMLPANTPMDFSVALGNSSAVPKRVQVILRTSDWAQAATCEFVLPANSPLAAYSVQVRTAAVWNDILAQVWTYAPDGLPAVRLDTADLRYRPTLTVNTTPDCLNQGGPILVNGQFEINTAGWSYVNYTSFAAVGGQLQVTHPASASYAAFWQELALPLPSGRAFEFAIDLSNTTGAARDAQLIVRGPDWNTARICSVTLPGDGVSRRYTLRGTANGAWSSLFVQVWTFPSASGATLRADNAAFGTLGLGTTVPGGLACTG